MARWQGRHGAHQTARATACPGSWRQQTDITQRRTPHSHWLRTLADARTCTRAHAHSAPGRARHHVLGATHTRTRARVHTHAHTAHLAARATAYSGSAVPCAASAAAPDAPPAPNWMPTSGLATRPAWGHAQARVLVLARLWSRSRTMIHLVACLPVGHRAGVKGLLPALQCHIIYVWHAFCGAPGYAEARVHVQARVLARECHPAPHSARGRTRTRMAQRHASPRTHVLWLPHLRAW